MFVFFPPPSHPFPVDVSFQPQASLGTNFVESWTYSACLSIVDECERRISEDLNASETNFIAVKAELLELAKKQVRHPLQLLHSTALTLPLLRSSTRSA